MGDRTELEKLRRLKELETRVGAKRADPSVTAPKDSVEGMSGAQRFGKSMTDRANTNVMKLTKMFDDLGRGALDLVGVDTGDTPSALPWSTQAIRQAETEAAPLRDTGSGMAGELAADAIMTAPLGFVGRGMEAVAASNRLPATVGRIAGSRPAQAAVEGGIAGALNADPEQRGEGAFQGATAGAVLERGGRLLGRTLQGLVLRSPEARQLEQLADLHQMDVKLPLAQAASDQGVVSPLMKFVYGRVLPSLPGAEGAMAKQAQRSGAQFRELAMKEAAPGGLGSTQKGYAAGLPLTAGKQAGAGSDMRVSMKDIQDAFQREYSTTIKSYAFNQPQTADFAAYLQQKFPNIDSATLNGAVRTFDSLSSQYSKNGVLDGDNLIRMKSDLANLGRQSKNDRAGQSFFQAQEFLDDLVRTEMRQGNNPQNLLDLQRYEDLAEPWRNFQRVQRATARSKDPEGQFTPQELSRVVKSMGSDRELARGAAPMQELAALGERTVGQPIPNPSFLERAATMSALGGMGILTGPGGAAALYGIGRGAASPAVQDVLMGTTKTQKALADALRKRPLAKRLVGADVRNTLAGEVAEDEPEQ